MSLHESTHGRHRDSLGDGNPDVPNGAGQNGPWIHRQMDGQNQRAERADDRPEEALSDVGLDGDADDGPSGSDPEQRSASAYRSKAVGGDEADGDADDEGTDSVASASETAALVRDTADEHTVESTERFDGMQSHLGRRPESVSCVEGCAVSDIAAFQARKDAETDDQADEPDPCVAQASGYLARE